MQLLAFDFGLRSIGVASGHSATQITSELAPLRARDGIPNWDQIAKLLDEWQPKALIVGLPLNMDGSSSELSARAEKFGRRLHGRFNIIVHMQDERLSSRDAKAQADERGHRGNYVQDPVDSIAARLILESWLNEQRDN